jgi:SOS response associated peptidase (SRAP)
VPFRPVQDVIARSSILVKNVVFHRWRGASPRLGNDRALPVVLQRSLWTFLHRSTRPFWLRQGRLFRATIRRCAICTPSPRPSRRSGACFGSTRIRPATYHRCQGSSPIRWRRWFALSEERHLAAFAGIWRPWTGTRGTKAEPVDGEHRLFSLLTTDANAEVGAVHPKAMPAILTTEDEFDAWMTAPGRRR